MLKVHYTLALGIIALVSSTFLMMKTCSTEFCCKKFAKVVSVVAIVLSILIIVCTIGNGIRAIASGKHMYGSHKKGWHGKMMQPEMMEKMKKDCPMMKMMMEEQDTDGSAGTSE